MGIYHGLDDFSLLPFAVVTSGTFDGVHVGHQQILTRLKEIANRTHGETVLMNSFLFGLTISLNVSFIVYFSIFFKLVNE